MSKLEELIARLCPDGVEYKTTNDVKITSFWLMPATPKFTDKGVEYITSKNIKSSRIDFNDTKYISFEAYQKISKNREIQQGDLLVTMIGSIGEAAFVNEDRLFYGQNLYLIRLDESKIDRKYYYYYLTMPRIKDGLVSKKNASSQGYIKAGSLDSLKLPVPPLEVQREIVHILDSFTFLTAELAAELAARQKQYEWYKRNLIEDISDSRDLFRLKDVASYVRERVYIDTISKKNYVGVENLLQDKKGKTDATTIPSSGNVIGFQKDDILLGNIRPYLKKIWFADIEGGTNGDVLAIRANNRLILPKYLYYILSTDSFFLYDNSHSKGAKMPRGNKEAIMDYEFSLPPLSEQQRIVDILDRFDALCNDITSGLPAEIEARRKQYEYYRDKLLTFKELKKEA